MSRKRNISARLDFDDYHQLVNCAKADGVSRSQVIQKAIASYLHTHEERMGLQKLSRQLSQVSVTTQETQVLLKGLIQALSEISEEGDFR